MSRNTVTFTAQTTAKFVANPKRGSDYLATIQNLSGQSIIVTVTNQDIQSASPAFDTPGAGEVAIDNGAIGVISQPYDGWLITAAAETTGTVEIVEAG